MERTFVTCKRAKSTGGKKERKREREREREKEKGGGGGGGEEIFFLGGVFTIF